MLHIERAEEAGPVMFACSAGSLGAKNAIL